MGFEFAELKGFKADLVELNKRIHQVHMKIANRIGLMAIRRVKKMTPVDTGDLRNNWKHQVFKKGNEYIIVIYNQLEYASFVENGHRIVRGGVTVGWVDGRFMLKLTMDEMNRLAGPKWIEAVDKEMRDIFGY